MSMHVHSGSGWLLWVPEENSGLASMVLPKVQASPERQIPRLLSCSPCFQRIQCSTVGCFESTVECSLLMLMDTRQDILQSKEHKC